MSKLTPETLRALKAGGQLRIASYEHDELHLTASVNDALDAHADAWAADKARLEAAEREILDWRATHYGDVFALGELDAAEFDKRIASINAERAALAAQEGEGA